ncbi:MAG: hypothetical protein IT495_05490 [Gammaproteobacteria bacterium]|nr:hypothetical protein [Gammaproteobacteria bacterium]
MESQQLITLAVSAAATLALLGVGLVIWYAVGQQRRQREALGRLAAGAGLGEIRPNETCDAEIGGQICHYRYHPGARNSPASFEVWIPVSSTGRFKLRTEHAIDRVFKGFGITVEVQTRDRRFDQRFFIQSPQPQFARAVFAEPARREAVAILFQRGFREVTLDNGALTAVIRPFGSDSLARGADLHEVVRALVTIGGSLPSIDPGEVRRPLLARLALVYTLAIGAVAAGFSLMFIGLANYPPFDGMAVLRHGLYYAVPAAFAFLVLAIGLLKGHSTSHYHVMANAGLALVAAPVLGFGASASVNGYYDTAAPATHEAPVLARRFQRNKNDTRYYLRVRSWRAGYASEEIEVSADVYRRAGANSLLVVRTRPGHLGFDWLVDYRMVENLLDTAPAAIAR